MTIVDQRIIEERYSRTYLCN